LGSLIFVHLLSGELAQANEVTQQFAAMGARTNNAYIEAWASYVQGYIHYQWNSLETASRHFSEAVKQQYFLDQNSPIDNYAGLMFSYEAMQQSDKASETAKLALGFAQQSNNPNYVVLARSAQARLSLLQGDLESAVRWLETADISSDAGTMLFWLEMPRITQCRVLVAQGAEASLREAIERLREHCQLSETAHNAPQTIVISLLQALAYLKQKQADKALTALERAVTLARPGGWIRPFVELGPTMAGLLVHLSQRGVAQDYIAQILAAFPTETTDERPRIETAEPSFVFRPLSPSAGGATGGLVEPLTNRELEVLELMAQRMTNKEIAAQLVVSVGTVKNHAYRINQKLNVRGRRQAVAKATSLGILSTT
jgi:LuxR family maltose regulon positive regulatory protein